MPQNLDSKNCSSHYAHHRSGSSLPSFERELVPFISSVTCEQATSTGTIVTYIYPFLLVSFSSSCRVVPSSVKRFAFHITQYFISSSSIYLDIFWAEVTAGSTLTLNQQLVLYVPCSQTSTYKLVGHKTLYKISVMSPRRGNSRVG